MINVRYKKKGWTDWVWVTFDTEDKAEKFRTFLRSKGYEVE